MSLSRQLLNDMYPLFRLLQEPLRRPAAFYAHPSRRSLLDDPFSHPSNTVRPALDITEQENNYIVEAELPGVKKENLEVRIGDAGRSVTIEGKTFRRNNDEWQTAPAEPAQQVSASEEIESKATDSTAVEKLDGNENAASTNIATESSSFSRTIWLPQAVDEKGVSAKLAEGILTLTIPKVVDTGSVKVNVE